MLTEETSLTAMREAAGALPTASLNLQGRGIVVPAGGFRYYPSAWVCIHVLRHLGCHLPIEVWHLGPKEMSEEMCNLLAPLGVTCIDAEEVRLRHPARRLFGWELKSYAMLHCGFREVLLLDADNVTVVNPHYLFEIEPYKEHGAVFWPDYMCLPPEDAIWKLTGVPYRREPAFESGQILVDKLRCWDPLALTVWMNEHSDFWYRHIYGDKDTFHFAWRALGHDYAMPHRGDNSMPGVICQYDFEGRRIFQHRHGLKWAVDCRNRRLRAFEHEEFCHQAIADLERRWTTRPTKPFDCESTDAESRRVAGRLCRSRWSYQRDGGGSRAMSFGMDGRIYEGGAECEQTWRLNHEEGRWGLTFSGKDGVTCELHPLNDEQWRGQWVIYERNAVRLDALTDEPIRPFYIDVACDRSRHLARQLCSRPWRYRRVGFDERTIRFNLDGTLSQGQEMHESWWNVLANERGESLWIGGINGLTCVLVASTDGRWCGQWLVHERMPVDLIPDGTVSASDLRFQWNSARQGLRRPAGELTRRRWLYRRVGMDERYLSFGSDGVIHEGAACCERYWSLRESDGACKLSIYGVRELTCELTPGPHGQWMGQWVAFNSPQVELVAAGPRIDAPYEDHDAAPQFKQAARRLCQSDWTYRRVGHDMRRMGFDLEGRVTDGAADFERTWRFTTVAGRLALQLLGLDGVTAVLIHQDGSLWRGRWVIHEGMAVELADAGRVAGGDS